MSILVFAAVVSAVFASGHSLWHPLILFGAAYLGCRTRAVREGETRLSQPVSLGVAAAIAVVGSAAVYYYTESFPGGLPQATALALCMMLWVALLGASITTFERSHLALEFGEKLWPKRHLHLVKAFGRLLTAVCCIFLLWMSWIAVNGRYDNWVAGDYRADLVPGLDAPFTLLGISANGLPQWLVLVIMPYTFAAMAIRLAAQAYTLATRKAKPEEEQLPT
jgi:TRAP-type C4-dicarboxylate transport system permease small subunit